VLAAQEHALLVVKANIELSIEIVEEFEYHTMGRVGVTKNTTKDEPEVMRNLARKWAKWASMFLVRDTADPKAQWQRSTE
jgi:hypothetical protein